MLKVANMRNAFKFVFLITHFWVTLRSTVIYLHIQNHKTIGELKIENEAGPREPNINQHLGWSKTISLN